MINVSATAKTAVFYYRTDFPRTRWISLALSRMCDDTRTKACPSLSPLQVYGYTHATSDLTCRGAQLEQTSGRH